MDWCIPLSTFQKSGSVRSRGDSSIPLAHPSKTAKSAAPTLRESQTETTLKQSMRHPSRVSLVPKGAVAVQFHSAEGQRAALAKRSRKMHLFRVASNSSPLRPAAARYRIGASWLPRASARGYPSAVPSALWPGAHPIMGKVWAHPARAPDGAAYDSPGRKSG